MIRPARERDIPKLIDLAESFHEDSAYRDFPIDRPSAYRSLAQCAQMATACLLVAEDRERGQITGFLAGVAQEVWFSRSRCATDLVFVSRRPSDSIKLVRQFVRWAWGVPRVIEVTMAISSGIHPERTGAFYERLGFTSIGGMYSMPRPENSAERIRHAIG